MKIYKIKVTKADIANGKPFTKRRRPVYLALKRTLKKTDQITHAVGVYFANIGDKDIILPFRVQKWLEMFDDNKPVGPFCFTLKYHKET